MTMILRAVFISALLIATAATDAGAQGRLCGMGVTDWCPPPPGDACGRHPNTGSCKADQKCFGMPYRGESVVACLLDSRGFASNCPTVGCSSTPPRRPRRQIGSLM
jgi:hypothetical protein